MIQKDKTILSEPCRICSGSEWLILYEGPIRTGKFGEYSQEKHVVWKCNRCKSGFLFRTPLDYEKPDYQEMVHGKNSVHLNYNIRDKLQVDKLNILGTGNLRGKTIADVGASAGSFIDLVQGYADTTIAVEPNLLHYKELSRKGHRVYKYCKECLPEWQERVDIAVCCEVLEHVEFPLQLLKEIYSLLKPNGFLLISTPNTDDWLLEFLPGIYDRFFYRYVHTWYFNRESIQSISQRAGFKETEILFKQRFDISNALHWARDNTPTGTGKFNLLQGMDSTYIQLIESLGRSDYIYAFFKK